MADNIQSKLSTILQKPYKSLDDATFLYERVRTLPFFNAFFTQNLRSMNDSDMLGLCRNFEYEACEAGEFVFEKGDSCNNKLYVVISGIVAILKPYTEEEKAAKRGTAPKTTKNIDKMRSARTKKTLDAKASLTIKNSSTVKNLLNQMTLKVEDPEFDEDTDPDQPNTIANAANSRRPNRNKTSSKKLPNNYEDFLADYGSLICCKSAGESFGELALKHDKPRAASIFCKTECEFLIVTKQQFDSMFLKKEQEKELFLRDTFPFVTSLMTSALNLNNLFCSFQTEVYSKGNYITMEGKIPTKDKMIFIIFHGECQVEKNVTIEQVEAFDKLRVGSHISHQTVKIAIIGKKAIVGEEVLITEDEYDYSVRVISDAALVYTITKEEFEVLHFHKEFFSYMMNIYNQKKNQRQLILENARKEHERKIKKYKSDNIRRQRVSQDTASHASIQAGGSFSHREMSSNNQFDYFKAEPVLLQKFPSSQTVSSSSPPNVKYNIPLNLILKSNRLPDLETESIHSAASFPKGAKGILKFTDTFSSKNQSMTSRLNLLSITPKIISSRSPADAVEVLESKRLFKLEEVMSPEKLEMFQKIKHVNQIRFGYVNKTNISPTPKNNNVPYSDIILRDVAKVNKKFQQPIHQSAEMRETAYLRDREAGETFSAVFHKSQSTHVKNAYIPTSRLLDESPRLERDCPSPSKSPRKSNNFLSSRDSPATEKPYVPLLRINSIRENEVNDLGLVVTMRDNMRTTRDWSKAPSLVKKASLERNRRHKPNGSIRIKPIASREETEISGVSPYRLASSTRDSPILKVSTFNFSDYNEKDSSITKNSPLKVTGL